MTIENAEGELETIDSTPKHPFYVEGLGWVEASSLHAGMTIWFANGTKGTVEDISNEGLEEPVTVYNFEVADFHTYFIGECGTLVHNDCEPYIEFNKTHKDSTPQPKGTGPNDGRLQSHHGLQQQWATENLGEYGYDPKLAPTVTIETGVGLPHTTISTAQNARRDTRVANGDGKWSSSLQDELNYLVSDFRNAGFSDDTIAQVLEQQYSMLDKLGVSYERVDVT